MTLQTPKSVLERTGLCRSALYRKVYAGTFPRQIKLSERRAGWRETDVERWLRNPRLWDVRVRRLDAGMSADLFKNLLTFRSFRGAIQPGHGSFPCHDRSSVALTSLGPLRV